MICDTHDLHMDDVARREPHDVHGLAPCSARCESTYYRYMQIDPAQHLKTENVGDLDYLDRDLCGVCMTWQAHIMHTYPRTARLTLV